MPLLPHLRPYWRTNITVESIKQLWTELFVISPITHKVTSLGSLLTTWMEVLFQEIRKYVLEMSLHYWAIQLMEHQTEF